LNIFVFFLTKTAINVEKFPAMVKYGEKDILDSNDSMRLDEIWRTRGRKMKKFVESMQKA